MSTTQLETMPASASTPVALALALWAQLTNENPVSKASACVTFAPARAVSRPASTVVSAGPATPITDTGRVR